MAFHHPWWLGSTIVLIVVAVSIPPEAVNGWPLSVDNLSESEKGSIDKLRDIVKDDLTHDYMHEDVYLLRWLIVKNFKVDQAAKLLRENLRWRRKDHVDTILEEDWSEMNARFPYELDTKDKDGRPLLYFSIDKWDISRLSSREGSLSKLGRYFTKMVEETDAKIREMRAEGHNVTQFNLLINMKGYTMQRHGCFRCMAFYSGLAQTMESHYPGSADKLMIVNAPPMFEAVYSYLKRGLTEKSRESMRIYGQAKKSWEPVLLGLLEKEKFPEDLK